MMPLKTAQINRRQQAEAEITPKVIEAGVCIFNNRDVEYGYSDDLVREIFLAMVQSRK